MVPSCLRLHCFWWILSCFLGLPFLNHKRPVWLFKYSCQENILYNIIIIVEKQGLARHFDVMCSWIVCMCVYIYIYIYIHVCVCICFLMVPQLQSCLSRQNKHLYLMKSPQILCFLWIYYIGSSDYLNFAVFGKLNVSLHKARLYEWKDSVLPINRIHFRAGCKLLKKLWITNHPHIKRLFWMFVYEKLDINFLKRIWWKYTMCTTSFLYWLTAYLYASIGSIYPHVHTHTHMQKERDM